MGTTPVMFHVLLPLLPRFVVQQLTLNSGCSSRLPEEPAVKAVICWRGLSHLTPSHVIAADTKRHRLTEVLYSSVRPNSASRPEHRAG